jgi:hypothetical protein
MGLDQWAFAIDNNGEKEELAYWRKHPNLQGWMENLWESKGRPNAHEDKDHSGMSDFNCVQLELTEEDLDSLEQDITNASLPDTVGFFFGSNSDAVYGQQDLEFVQKAREALDNGLTVVYDSWW